MFDWQTVVLFSVIGLGMATSLGLFVTTLWTALRAESGSA